ncbi:MAG: hypothetical protein QG577_596 [Thermodesulfobacteriota bacterium]|nr:hypothetical protein [Thermodesulfobacteriota bacterium]
MRRLLKSLVVAAALLAFAFSTVAVAAEFYVVKDAAGKVSVTDQKPADAKSVVKGPFPTKEDAEKELKAQGAAKKPVKLPTQGC